MKGEELKKGTGRAMDRVLYAKSGSSPPTPAASSAGASSPAIPANLASIDWCGVGKGRRSGSMSRTNGLLPWATGTSTSTAGGSTPGSSQPLCRPWDRGDLLKRLTTFNPSNWSAKPAAVGPLACSRRGWVSIDIDLIVCEACGAHLNFQTCSSWSEPQAGVAAESICEQLDSGHEALCPWKGNSCAESLVQFPATSISALIGGYDDRCDALLQLTALPVISGSGIEQMKLTRALQIDWLLAQPPLCLGRKTFERFEGCKVECSSQGFMHASNGHYDQALKLISLCGWEPRFLPSVVDCEEHSVHSARNVHLVRLNESPFHKICDPGPSMLRHPRTSRLEKKASSQSMMLFPEPRCSPASAVLECSLCEASVGLWNFEAVTRPSSLLNPTLAETPDRRQKYGEASVRGVSAASGIDGWCAIKAPVKGKREDREEAGDLATTGEQKSFTHQGVLDLNLTIAGGPTPTFAGSLGAIPLAASLSQAAAGQPEGSEMGGLAGSYESFGPHAAQRHPDDGGSTVDRPQSKMHRTDSIEGTIVDHEVDEVDGGEIGRRKPYLGESSKHKRARESSAANDLSYSVAATDTGGFDLGDPEAEGSDRVKRNRFNMILQEYYDPKLLSIQPGRGSVYASSVIAVDTSHSMEDNSNESVENFPQSSDAQVTSFSHEKFERVDYEELNLFNQAQQSMCQQAVVGRVSDGPSELGLSASDEGGGDLAAENDAVVFSAGVGMARGFSTRMSGGSVQMVASHEAQIHGADFSVHRTESIAGDTEMVTEVTESHRQTSESVPDRALTGEYVPEDVEKADVVHGLADSHEAAPSLSVVRTYTGMKFDESAQGESWGSEEKSQFATGERGVDTNCGLIVGGEEIHSMDATVARHDILGAHSVATTGEGRVLTDWRSWEHGREFDPLHHHHSFCPWVNAYVAAALTSDMSTASVKSGWQLTLDALDALHARAAPMESESAASMHKSDRLAVCRLIVKGSHPGECQGDHPNR